MSNNDQYISEVKKSITSYIYRVIPLDKDENELEEITEDVLDGTINISLQNGSRRTGSITLDNSRGEYNLSSLEGNLWLDNKFKIQTGIRVNGQDILFDQGIFVIGEYNKSNNSQGNATANIELYDKFSYLDGTISGEVVNTFLIPIGTNIVDAIRIVLDTAQTDGIQIAYDIKPLIAEANSFVTPYTMYIDKGKTYFDILKTLADAISYTVYFDKQGYPRFEPAIIPENEAPFIVFEEEDILKSSVNSRLEVRELKNDIRVEGITWENGVLHDANSTITTGATSVSRIGRRSLLIEDDVIYNDTLAQQRADYESDVRSKISETVNVTFYPVDNLDVGVVVGITDSRINISDGRYQVRQLNLPLRKDTEASMDTQRTVDII